MNINKENGQIILRISLSLVFFYFAISQLINPGYWTGFVPDLVLRFGLPAHSIVLMNGVLELVLGLLLILGIFTRFSALLLSLHLLGIAASIGFADPTGIRDFGLALATLSVFFLGRDRFCLDNKLFRKSI